jgi:hypothetical protein
MSFAALFIDIWEVAENTLQNVDRKYSTYIDPYFL